MNGFIRIVTLMAALAALIASPVFAQDAEEAEAKPEKKAAPAQSEGTKTMAGMSILGNEETPKSLVIVPWKSSEMGDELSLSDTLEDLAKPVDKEVFQRELHFYELRAAK